MISDTYEPLIDQLIQRTSEGAVNWHPTSDEGEFVVYFDDFSLSLRLARSSHDPNSCVLTVMDNSGKQLDWETVEEGEKGWIKVSGLHDMARRKAMRIDDALSTILKELKGNSPGKKQAPPRPTSSDDDIPF